MILLTDVFSSLFVIFALAIPGIIFKKLNIVEDNQLKLMSKFMMNVILPAVIVYSMQIEFSNDVFISGLKVFLAVFLLFGIIFLISIVLSFCLGLGKKYIGVVTFVMFFANTGGIGIPVMNMLFGVEAAFYASAAEMATDVLIFTAGVLLMKYSGKSDEGIDLRTLINPGTFAIIIGAILFLTNTRIPSVINNVLQNLSNASLPVAMFIIGVQIGGINLKYILTQWHALLISVLKLTIPPICMYLIAIILNCPPLPAKVLATIFAMPTGVAAAIFAQQYNADTKFTVSVVFATDILCLITIPIIVIVM